MAASTLVPVKLNATATHLQITWNDGVVHEISWQRLRDACPCANCKVRRSEPPVVSPFNIIKPEEAAPIRVTAMRPAGNYAYNIDFSDGHTTGIYSLDLLRTMGAGA